MAVNTRVVPMQRPPWSVFDGPGRGGVSRRTGAALQGSLGAYGLSVPLPTDHAGRIANKTVARLMWTRQSVRLRWHSPINQEPWIWRIYAGPRSREATMRVLRDVIAELGQGTTQIRVGQDASPFPDESWYVEIVPGALALPPEADIPEEGVSGVETYGWGPKRYPDFGPPEWRSEGRPSVQGYSGLGFPPDPRMGIGPYKHRSVPLPPPPLRPEVTQSEGAAVAAIVGDFRERGQAAGLDRARRAGPRYLAGAKLWVAIRAHHEEQLASLLAKLRARTARHRAQHPNGCAICDGDRIKALFVETRLEEVRGAVKAAHTPAQAVADKPDVPQTRFPRWVQWTMLGLAVLGAARTFGSSGKGG